MAVSSERDHNQQLFGYDRFAYPSGYELRTAALSFLLYALISLVVQTTINTSIQLLDPWGTDALDLPVEEYLLLPLAGHRRLLSAPSGRNVGVQPQTSTAVGSNAATLAADTDEAPAEPPASISSSIFLREFHLADREMLERFSTTQTAHAKKIQRHNFRQLSRLNTGSLTGDALTWFKSTGSTAEHPPPGVRPPSQPSSPELELSPELKPSPSPSPVPSLSAKLEPSPLPDPSPSQPARKERTLPAAKGLPPSSPAGRGVQADRTHASARGYMRLEATCTGVDAAAVEHGRCSSSLNARAPGFSVHASLLSNHAASPALSAARDSPPLQASSPAVPAKAAALGASAALETCAAITNHSAARRADPDALSHVDWSDPAGGSPSGSDSARVAQIREERFAGTGSNTGAWVNAWDYALSDA